MKTLDECIKQFIDDYSFKLEKSTLKASETSIRQLVNFCDKPYYELSTRDIRSWLMHLKEKGYMPGSILTKLLALRLFYRYCIEEVLMNYNPVETIPIPKREDKLPHYLTMHQLVQLRMLCDRSVKQRAVIEMFYATGVRIRELTSMKLEDISWSDRIIQIPNGKGKKERIVLFTKECAEHLNTYLKDRDDDLPYVFLNCLKNGPIHRRTIQKWFRIYREKLGIFMTPHTLRHTFAAHLAIKGMPIECIQVLLGHDNPHDTHLYARLHQQAQKQMYDVWM